MKVYFQIAECSLSSAKIVQTSAMKVYFQIAECSLSSANLDKISELEARKEQKRRKKKKNKMKVLVAVAKKMPIAVWHVLHDNTIYIDFTTDRKM